MSKRWTVRIEGEQLPLNSSFFCCVDFRRGWYVTEQIAFDVVEKEILSVGTGEIKAIVIDDLGLFLQPPAPTRLANLSGDALSERVRKGRKAERWSLLSAVCAFDCVCH